MKHRGMKILAMLLTLTMLVGLMPGMGLTAYAEETAYSYLIPTNADDATALASKVVKFNNIDWYIIADNSTAKRAGTVTLLAKDPIGDARIFDSSTKDYGQSQIKDFLKGLTEETGDFFSVKDCIADTDITDVTTHVTGAKLYLLSKTEAEGLPANVLKSTMANGCESNNNYWWLRTPDDSQYSNSYALRVYGDDGEVRWGNFVYFKFGVRPALKLDLSKVTFDSTSNTFTVGAASYTVTLRPNGGSGEDMVSTVDPNDIYELPICNYNPPEGKTFTGWKLRQDGNTYKPGQKFTVTSALDFDAQWGEPVPGGDSDGGSGSGFDLVFNIPGADNSWEYVGGYAPQQAYRVSLAPMQGGSAALGLTTGESGTALNVYPTSAVYVFPNADPGYTLDKIVWSLIDGSASYDITEAKNFVMPAMDVVVYVTFRPVG